MRKTTLVTLAALGFSFILLLSPNGAFGQDIQPFETINVDPTANFQETPRSFCLTEDKLFLILSDQNGTTDIFSKEGNSLKFVKALGPKFAETGFMKPFYCFYSRNEAKLGVMDYAGSKVFIFERQGLVDFTPIKTVNCPKLGYDMEFAGDGEQLVVSGSLSESADSPFDLYSINIRTGQIDYLLPSHQKYGLKTFKDYVREYREKQTLPAIGIKAFIDIQGDDIYFVWEGALRVIKINLRSRETTAFNGRETPHYTRPDGSRLGESYKKGDFKTVWKEREKMAYVSNIFTTSSHVYIVYETAKRDASNTRMCRLQTYKDGDFQGDVLIRGNPGRQMWFDKGNDELYALSRKSKSGEFSILKYKINR